ncbi:MAG: class I SAM-dependent methyltransferase [Burkholderiales bacterium]|nr:class I SAM-dependent methyltransferase [Burkholderiales bacterium]MDR4518074.1 class I SAM-dependent methyltransferase [Nitrosomonas sp.]
MGQENNIFFDSWTVYDQILDHNYMFHNELFVDLQEFLVNRFANNPITVLDLGCGSARHLTDVLTRFAVAHYRGYDLSETALKFARRNLITLDCPVELIQDDLLSGLKKQDKLYDVVFSSFACHHLNETEKQHFFQMANQCLTESGVLVLIDVVRDEDENLSVYLDRYCDWLRSNWGALHSEALEVACEHIYGNDRSRTNQ